jgi:predicted homoserine dehydrogenase-like protein
MILIDSALAKRQEDNNPITVGIIGAGYMGRGIAMQILTSVPGMHLAAISNRTVSKAEKAYAQGGATEINHVSSVSQLEDSVQAGQFAVTDDPFLLCQADGIDAVIEVTGEIEFGAHVVMSAIKNGKHVILMNAELDATVGPLLKKYADEQGVIYTNADGDQPGVIMNLFRYVQSIGLKPVLAGNMKGLQDPYRTPETQKAFAEMHNQEPRMVTSFADGSKISMEMAVVANATGFGVGTRGMYGYRCEEVDEAKTIFDLDPYLGDSAGPGIVDYVLGAKPPGGVFVVAHQDDPIQRQYLQYYKLGDGPLYVFYTPFHICHFEAPLTVARAVHFGDAAIAPTAGPVVDVLTAAKHDLKAGQTLDYIGGFDTYGVAENSAICLEQELLPMGLAEGCVLSHDIAKDQIISYADITLPEGRLCDQLRSEQTATFS